ncbi:uncharacterized protein LOC131885769 isoform X2 [Tigriopus californicus]|uniref:uncharacterized protein LOC131885769 isoform X2 n=1 Tax=Tigriopus californicus TaxID=6832 RepID=UPI0027DA66F0|nr:uncharacterized protein LOC131885769 isoform X2 [Tigriopus californicus]
MIPGDMFNYVKKVLGPEGGPRTPRAPRTRKVKTAAEMVSKENAVRQRYGMEIKKTGGRSEDGTLDKLKETFSTGFQTATETVTKLTPGSGSCQPITTASVPTFQRNSSATTLWKSASSTDTTSIRKSSIATPTTTTPPSLVGEASGTEESNTNAKSDGTNATSAVSGGGSGDSSKCKVCMKVFGNEEFFKVCSTCIMPVCEDCSVSYNDDNHPSQAKVEPDNWVCSICTRRRSTRDESLLASSNNYLKSKQGNGTKRVDMKHESFDVASGGGLMVPQVPQARRHSTGNAAAIAALQAANNQNAAASAAPGSLAQVAPASTKKKGSFDGGRVASAHQPQQVLSSSPRPSGRVTSRRPSDNNLNALMDNDPMGGGPPGGGGGANMGRRCSMAVPRSRGPGGEANGNDMMNVISTRGIAARGRLSSCPKINASAFYSQQQPQSPSHQPPKQRSQIIFSKDKMFNSESSGEDLSSAHALAIVAARDWQNNARRRRRHTSSSYSNVRYGSTSSVSQDYLGGDFLGIGKPSEERRSSFESACSDSAALGQVRDRFVDEEASRRFHSMERSSHHPQQQKPLPPHPQHLQQQHQHQQQQHEAIRIVVDHVDTSGAQAGGMRKVRSRSSSIVPPREYQITLYCDSHSPYGFGLRVVGAEGGYARVLWICPGGPAEQAGIRVGDKIFDWNNIPLSSVPLEHIPQMIEHCDMDAVKATIQTGGKPDEGPDLGGGNGGRRLPNLPSSGSSPRPSISMSRKQPREVGYVQFGLNYDEPNLLVTLWAAENLQSIENHEDVSLPQPYAIVRLCLYGRNRTFTTGVEESTPHPIWRTKHLFTDLERDELNASQLEISVWNYSNAVKHECLGKTLLSAPDVDLDGSLHWFPLYLSDGNVKSSESQSLGTTDMVQQGHLRKSQDMGQPNQGLLHLPMSIHDLRRRSSAFSEESHPISDPVFWVEPVSRSLPGSRRASRASALLRVGRTRSSSTSMPLERKG